MSHPTVSRRRFLHTTGFGGLAAVLASQVAPTLVRAQTSKPAGKLGVALVGLGGFSTVSIAPELKSAQNVYLAGVVTGSAEKGRAWAKDHGFPERNIYNYDTFDQIAGNPDIDVVHIVLPNGMHAEFTERAARAGKHVMVEKPMAISAKECGRMIAACRQAGVQLGVNYRLHFEPHHLKMMELARENVFGPVKSISAEFSWRRGDNKPWLLDRKLAGGGAAFDTGVYPIQAACYTTGETPIRASAIATSTRDVYQQTGLEETMAFTLEFPSGVIAQCRASYAYSWHQFTVSADSGTFACTVPPTGGSVFGQSGRGNPNRKQVSLPKNETFKTEDTLQLAVLHDRFAESIQQKKAFACPGEMGLRDAHILEAVYASSTQNGKAIAIAT